MNNDLLLLLKTKANGRVALKEEIEFLEKNINFIPKWYCDLILNYPLLEINIEISENDDLSNVGVDLLWLTPTQTVSELLESYPGKSVKKFELIPFGNCATGSGNPYFIDTRSNDQRVIRVIHDEFDQYSENIQELVQNSFEKFLSIYFL